MLTSCYRHSRWLLPSGSESQVQRRRFQGACPTRWPRYRHRLPQRETPHSNWPRTRVRITCCSVSRSFSGIMPLVISILIDRQRVECIAGQPTPSQGSLEVPAASPLCFVDQSLEHIVTAAILSRIPQPASAYNSCTEPKPYPGSCVVPCNLRWRAA
jgi:hypothetical protein